MAPKLESRIRVFPTFHGAAIALSWLYGCAGLRIRALAREHGTGSMDVRIRAKAHPRISRSVRFRTGTDRGEADISRE
jgi:hypothetical protein